jgi:CheY-like chemotaxis protein
MSDKRILIVEDAPEIQTLLARLLKSRGYHIDCVSNGLSALEFLHAAGELPDLILLDLMMPEMDGYQFRQRQESEEKLRDIPLVVMTAGGDIQAKAEQVGAQAYLRKPFSSIDTILDTVGRFFSKAG